MEFEDLNLLSESLEIQGKLVVKTITKFRGKLEGEILGLENSHFILSSEGSIQGDIRGFEITVDGLVRGNVFASKKILLTSNARVFGNLHSPQVEIEPGSFFQGQAKISPES